MKTQQFLVEVKFSGVFIDQSFAKDIAEYALLKAISACDGKVPRVIVTKVTAPVNDQGLPKLPVAPFDSETHTAQPVAMDAEHFGLPPEKSTRPALTLISGPCTFPECDCVKGCERL